MKFGAPALLLTGDKPAKSRAEEDESSVDAAKDVLEAIADKDPGELDLALRRHYEMCEGDSHDEEE